MCIGKTKREGVWGLIIGVTLFISYKPIIIICENDDQGNATG